MNKNLFCIPLLCLLLALGNTVWSQCNPASTAGGSPCAFGALNAFCTDENPLGITYPSSTNSPNASAFTGSSSVGCCGSTPNPAWYFMRIDQPGNLLIYIEQYSGTTGRDVDFVCWGPFQAASVADFKDQLCCQQYNLTTSGGSSHRPSGGNHNNDLGGYPVPANATGNTIPIIDCSYYADPTEWCYIPNAQYGDFYLLLLTNFSNQPATITFNRVANSSTATTDCQVLMPLESNSPICEGQVLIINNPTIPLGSSNITYQWSGPGGFNQTTTGPTLEIPNATSANSGRYRLIMTSGSVKDTVYSDSLVVTPTPQITFSISDGTTFCEGEPVNLNVGFANHPYGWFSISGPNGYNNGAPISTFSVPPFDIHNDTCFNVSVRVSSGDNFCYAQDTVCFICARTSSGLIEEQICVGSNYNNHGFTLPVQNAPLDTLLTATYTNTAGCDSTAQVLLHVTSNPLIEEIQNDVEHCGRQDGNLIVSVTQGTEPLQYTWSPDVAPLQRDSLLNIHGGTYQLDVVDSFGCRDSHTFEVVALPNPVACFNLTPESPSYLVGENIVFNNCSQYQDYNHWNMGDNTTFDTYGVSYTYNEIGAYTISLEVTDEAGCTDRTEKLIEVHEKMRFYLPNSFTPDGDGINDIFIPVQMEVKDDSYSMIIYDRWGSLVFKTQDLNIGWDGTVNGKLVEKGSMFTYFTTYKDIDGQVYEKNGTVTVLY